MSQTNPADQTAGEICAAIAAGELSSRDALEAHLERVEARNGPINAVVALDAEGARSRADEADAALQRRFAIIQTWRSIAPAVESEPLALCDGRTIPETGFIRNQRRYRDRTAETYHITYNPAHRWYYFPLMTRDEALVFKVFDTDASAGVRYTAHTAFDDPLSPPDAKPRESIEMRAFAFF